MQLYFVAIQIPSPINAEIKEFQQEMADLYNSSRQLKIPVHITLIPPFRYGSEEKVLDAFDKATSPISSKRNIVLKGFDQFREKVLFVAVEADEELKHVRSEIMKTVSDELSLEWPTYTNNFHPHITIANRDLNHNAFKKAWPTFKDRPYFRTFNKIEIVLYKHINGFWEVLSSKIISE